MLSSPIFLWKGSFGWTVACVWLYLWIMMKSFSVMTIIFFSQDKVFFSSSYCYSQSAKLWLMCRCMWASSSFYNEIASISLSFYYMFYVFLSFWGSEIWVIMFIEKREFHTKIWLFGWSFQENHSKINVKMHTRFIYRAYQNCSR